MKTTKRIHKKRMLRIQQDVIAREIIRKHSTLQDANALRTVRKVLATCQPL